MNTITIIIHVKIFFKIKQLRLGFTHLKPNTEAKIFCAWNPQVISLWKKMIKQSFINI